jgi:ABC-2 type transport system ATP-binding protein
MPAAPAIVIDHVSHAYGARTAVDDLSLTIATGELFALLGPNGSGKTTLFRVLSTLIPLQRGAITVLGRDIGREANAVRRHLGVVFQAPSLDKKLTVAENLRYQGRLYGLTAVEIKARSSELLAAVGLIDRTSDRVETLSGGMRRRVELAKCLLHRPTVLVLDEPSTGLDPASRIDLWRYLAQLRATGELTIVLTTHLLDEADRADRIAILHEGRLAAVGEPLALRGEVGGDAITIQTDRPEALAAAIRDRFHVEPQVVDGAVRLEQPDGRLWIPRLVEALPDHIQTITLGKPTLEDVFIQRTGHRFVGTLPLAPPARRKR